MQRSRREVLAGIGTVTAAAAVGGGAVVTAQSGSDAPPGEAAVRVVHASPDAPNVDVFVDGSKVLSDVAFRTVSDYLRLSPGTVTVKITAAGDESTVAFEGDLTLEASDYTVAAIGELADGTFEPLVLEDDGSTEDHASSVRVVHAAPDAPAVDVTLNEGETTLVDGAAFGDATGYLPVDPGEYELEIRPDSAGSRNPFDAEFPVHLGADTAYTVFATGYFTPGDEPGEAFFDLLPAVDGAPEPAVAKVRVAHASPDAPNVDVYVDGSAVLTDVPFGAVSEYLELSPGTYTVTITAAGDESTVAFEGDLTLEEGAYTVAAAGELTEDTFEPQILEDDLSGLDDGVARLRLVHLSPDAPAVDVTYRGRRAAFDDVAFSESQTVRAYAESASDLSFKIREAEFFNNGEVLAELGPLDLQGGKVYTLFAEGYLTPDDEPAEEAFQIVTSAVDAVDD